MKKLILSLLIVVGASSLAMAQNESKFKVSIGPELSFATGAFSNTHSFGIGGSAQAEVLLQQYLYGTATFGVMIYNGKSSGPNTNFKAATIIPIRIGAKYFLSGGVYGALQLGVGFLSNTNPSSNILLPNTNNSGSAFAYSPQLGYEFKTKKERAIDASFKYDGYSGNSNIGTVGAISFRVAYIF